MAKCFIPVVFICCICLAKGLYLTNSTLLQHPDCGVNQGCYHDCTRESCGFLIAWKNGPDEGLIELTIMKKLEHDQPQYIAVGFSDDTKMGNDSVIECLLTDYYSDVNIIHSYNENGKRNTHLSHPKQGVTMENLGIYDGVLVCNFLRSIHVPQETRIFNLDTDWYIMVATGLLDANGVGKLKMWTTLCNNRTFRYARKYCEQSGRKQRHSLDTLPWISPRKIDLQSNEEITGRHYFIYLKVHGCLMVIGWVFTAGLGIILSRHFKPIWRDRKVCLEKAWFQLHRLLMTTATMCTCAGFVLVFLDVRDWSYVYYGTDFQRAHPILGVIVTSLTVINFLAGCLRPQRGTRSRSAFKWFHWFVGTVVQILSVLTMIIGVTFVRVSVPFYVMWILVAFGVYMFAIYFILDVQYYWILKSGKLEQYYRAEGSGEEPSFVKNPPGWISRTVIFATHVAIVSGFTAVILFLILAH